MKRSVAMEREKRSYHCGGKGPWGAGKMVRGIAIGLIFALVFGLVVKILWNWLTPGVFGLREINYAQAVGLIVLTRILFGIRGMRPGFAARLHGHGGWGGPCSGEGIANGHIRDWRQYDAWWEEEGREAFKKYIDSHKQ
jgi:hypothetical protein